MTPLITPPGLPRDLTEIRARLRRLEARQDPVAAATVEQVEVFAGDGSVVGHISVLGVPGGTVSAGTRVGFAGFAMRDAGGTMVAGDDPTGAGLARPYLALPWTDARPETWPATTSGSFDDLQAAVLDVQHPAVEVWLRVAPDSGVTGEFQLLQGGDVIGSGITAAGPTARLIMWRVAVAGSFGDRSELRVQGRVVTGAGAVRGTVIGSWGVSSA